MTSQLGNEIHRFDFDEVSGLPQDKVGSKHADQWVTPASTVYNGSSISTINNNNSLLWLPGNEPFDVTNNMSFYLVYRLISHNQASSPPSPSFNAVNAPIYTAYVPTAPAQQITQTQDSLNAPPGTTRFFTTEFAGSPFVQAGLGRAPNTAEIFVTIFSLNLSTRTLIGHVRSDQGINSTGTDTKPTGTLPAVSQGFRIGSNRTGVTVTSLEMFQLGSFATSYSQQDIEDTAAALLGLAVNAPPTGNFNSVVQRP